MRPDDDFLKLLLMICSAIVAISGVSGAYAHPVVFKDAVAITAGNSPMMTDYWLTYGVTSRLAASLRYWSFRSDRASGPGDRTLVFPQANYLIQRWNQRDSRANLYAMGGFGIERQNGISSRAAVGTLEADWESRKYYLAGKHELVRFSKHGTLDYTMIRAGIAPYVAEYGALHTWFMIQVERQPETFEKIQITPLLRFFYQNVLWEIGASTRGNWLLNLMVHF